MKNKVFFNNSCNICRAEINHYKKHSNQDIEWVNVINNKEAQDIFPSLSLYKIEG